MPTQQVMLWVGAYFLVILWALMQWKGKLPSIQAVQELASVINSRGGNIMVLGGMSILFFVTAIRFVYWFIGNSAIDGKVDVGNSYAMSAFTWVTGSAFGGAFTSMVKAMTGENTKARASDTPGGNGTVGVVVTPGKPVITPISDVHPTNPHPDTKDAPNQAVTAASPQV